jgi:short-subunit dehydrogenase involved in D-alanine esterification of teichoic acids
LLVNNAGFANRDLNNIPDRRFTIETNLHGVINLTDKLWPALTENAKVVVVSSGLG